MGDDSMHDDDVDDSVDDKDELLRILRDPRLWEDPPVFVTYEEVEAIFREADAEAARAEAICERLLTGPSMTWAARFGESPEARHPIVVNQLLERVPNLLERRVMDAFHATSIAVAIAENLDLRKHIPFHVEFVRGLARWKHASVLAHLGLYREALGLVERAERIFAQNDVEGSDLKGFAQLKERLLAETGGAGTGPGDPRVGAGLLAGAY